MPLIIKDPDNAAAMIDTSAAYGYLPDNRECAIQLCNILNRKEPSLKRPFDVTLSVIGLILSAWLWVVIWIMIIFEDGMPVIIRQRRIGRGGKIFDSLKFRSMVKSALNDRIKNQAVEHDGRVTNVGRFLRRTALDELPQLLNVIKGDMSFVGPRPLLSNEIEINGDPGITNIEAIPNFAARNAMRPGLTGIAQIFAPRDIPRKHKFKYDLLYRDRMNLMYDIELIFTSVMITLTGSWEKRDMKLRFLRAKAAQQEHRLLSDFITLAQHII